MNQASCCPPSRRLELFSTPLLLALLLISALPSAGSTPRELQLTDVFELEWASDPQISPDGREVVYVRNFMDKTKDRRRSNLWIVSTDGGDPRPLTTGLASYGSPRFSPDGRKLLYVSSEDGSAQIYVRWLEGGETARLTQLERSPGNLAWSPDGRFVAFTMFVPEKAEPMVSLPSKPEGAEWAEPPRVIEKLIYRRDGGGYTEDGHDQVFVLPAEGGTPRQLTSGSFDHGGRLAWTTDGESLLFSANRHDDWEYDPNDSELWQLRLADGSLRQLTDRRGPDRAPVVSPDGKSVAYLGHDERYLGYQVDRIYLLDLAGSGSAVPEPRPLTDKLDRDIGSATWSADGSGLFVSFTEHGNTKVAHVSLGGEVEVLAHDLGGTSLGRPYGGGSFSVARDGRFAYTMSRPDFPADIAVGKRGAEVVRLTRLNDDLFAFRDLGQVEEILYESSHDGREIQGWIAKPPDFDPAKKYPLILEIHGGPFSNYGDRFSAEIQLYAAAGYVVLYTNPRGSTSYGEDFGNLIHHAYPGNDYDDLMSGVDAVIERGYIDPENLFVTGGSGGGVLTAWIVGKTDRFRAAVVAKPVINWTSFVLTADAYNFFYKYWFPGLPWEMPETYRERSPLTYVGNVTTPTMLLTGEADYRTPISETEQFYQALKLRRIEAAMVRIPGASHGIASRPSQLVAKVAHILAWFERYRALPATPKGVGGRKGDLR